MTPKKIIFTQHSLVRIKDRGCTNEEVASTIQDSQWSKAEKNRLTCSKTFPFNTEWFGRFYREKEVVPVFVEEKDSITVITVYTFFRGGKI